jgi:hypothetical protein
MNLLNFCFITSLLNQTTQHWKKYWRHEGHEEKTEVSEEERRRSASLRYCGA